MLQKVLRGYFEYVLRNDIPSDSQPANLNDIFI
jgi:hypothetical protein